MEKDIGNMMNGDFLVKNDGGGVYGFENIKVKEEEVVNMNLIMMVVLRRMGTW